MLEARIEEVAGSGTFVAATARYTNNTGTPIVSVAANNKGSLIAGVYNLTFASVVAATSANCTVTPTNTNNPSATGSPNAAGLTRPAVAVTLDGTTAHSNVIEGLDIVFSNSGSFTNSWTGQIRVGYDFGSQQAFGSIVASTQRKIRAYNTGSDTATNCKARCLPNVVAWPKVGEIFAGVRPFAEDAVEKLSGTIIDNYAITVGNVTGSGASKTMDVFVDGNPVDVIMLDINNQPTGSEISSDDLNVTNYYRITTGDLTDVEFKLSEDATNSDTANIFIFDTRHIQIAPDESGSPGTWGTADVTLTESGQAAGVIRATGFASFWIRALTTDGADSESNPYSMNVALEHSTSVALSFAS